MMHHERQILHNVVTFPKCRPRTITVTILFIYGKCDTACGIAQEISNSLCSSRIMQTIHRFFNGPTPEERVRSWQTKLRSESRQLDREIRQVCVHTSSWTLQKLSLFIQLDMAANKARQTVKQLATKGDVKSARILAKEVVRSNKQKDRLSVSKARLGSIGTQLSQQMG
jgi:hypothetical protein